jgi:hypothetical protein
MQRLQLLAETLRGIGASLRGTSDPRRGVTARQESGRADLLAWNLPTTNENRGGTMHSPRPDNRGLRFILVALLAILALSAPASIGALAAQDNAAGTLVSRLDLDRYKSNVQNLAGFGTRYWNTEGNERARDWIQAQLESYGYEVHRHGFTASGRRDDMEPKDIDNVYATKVGTANPDRMYIISAHMDSFNTESEDQSFAPGANDDGSGTALVLEVARVYASQEVVTDPSIRFILWNAEEIGLVGARNYVEDRRELQGIEDPPGSGAYPEPTWLGVIQHDMMMFDHGMPDDETGMVAPEQIEAADVDIEYDADETAGGGAILLAARFLAANARYAAYPAEVGQFMQSTDSVPFSPFVPAISLRENERRNEIGRGADPQWHKNSDVYETYSDADFRLGFAAAQTTTAAIAELAGARIR